MGISVDKWRISVGLFYCSTSRGFLKLPKFLTFPILLIYLTITLNAFQELTQTLDFLKDATKNCHFYFLLSLLLIIALDIELNPGPQHAIADLSVTHLNIRSIRNKFDYIIENFLDFNILCFTESKRKAMNRNWYNQKANPALNTKAGNK